MQTQAGTKAKIRGRPNLPEALANFTVMQLSLGFSPCPNDTFIFYALLHNKIDTRGLTFRPFIHDVEYLNQMAIHHEPDVSKISFAAYLKIQKHYLLLTSGSALGNGCGPLLISKKNISADEMRNHTVAVPGINTTANFLFDTFFPQHAGKKAMLFSEIEDAVLNEDTETGVIIHENRFTYEKRGLKKIADLGELWENSTGFPIPLGGIIMKRTIDPNIGQTVNDLIRESVFYAFAHPEEAMDFVRLHAREMDESVMWQHINLYVNDFTKDLGEKGKTAINHFIETAVTRQTAEDQVLPVFIS